MRVVSSAVPAGSDMYNTSLRIARRTPSALFSRKGESLVRVF
jgi:hypothetical protein